MASSEQAPAGEMIIQCRQVSKSYVQGQVTVAALRQVSLEIEKGGFIALAGPSGSGKTTLLNMIGGLDRPDAGEIHLDGKPIHQLSQGALAEIRLHQIGFVFQSYNLIPVLTAQENVAYVMQLQGVGKKERERRARQILDEVGLEGKYDRRPAALSGGQQQRVAVARAIVSNPAIVLADEPTANLDSTTGAGLLEMMAALNAQRKITFIFSTHDERVMACAHRLVHLRDGRLTADRQQTPGRAKPEDDRA